MHAEGDYWTDVEKGMQQATKAFSDFNISLHIDYYDQYEFGSFISAGNRLLAMEPDGLVISPTIESETEQIAKQLQQRNIPYIFIDSNIPHLTPLAFYGQHANQSGYLPPE